MIGIGLLRAVSHGSCIRIFRIVALGDSLVVDPAWRKIEGHRHRLRLTSQDNSLVDLVFYGVKIRGELLFGRLLRQYQLKDLRLDRALSARGPGKAPEVQLALDGRDNVPTGLLVAPSWMPEIPRLEVSILQSPRLHLLNDPIGSGFVIGRSRQARPIDIGQKVHGVHDLGVVHLFFTNLAVDVGISR